MPKPGHLALLHRSEPLHRLPGVRAGVHRVRHASRHSMIHLEYVDRGRERADRAGRLHALRPADLRRSLPGRRDQAHRRRRRADRRASRAASPAATACWPVPFGVPEVYEDRQIMMKCDMCYDRTSVGKKPMCATVCPSQALFFGTREQIEQLRPHVGADQPFQFGSADDHHARVHRWCRARRRAQPMVDVTAAMDDDARTRDRASTPSADVRAGRADPFAEVEV